MHKRIFHYFAGLILVCIMALAVLFSILFARAAQAREMASIEETAHLIAGLLNQGDFEYENGLRGRNTRFTVISPQGRALFDSFPGADLNVNRSDRAEFITALTYGSGSAIRRSDTFGAETFYYAILLDSGNVLRLSGTLNSLRAVFPAILPDLVIITVAILILAYYIAYRLTQRIVRPLTDVDFENPEIIDSQHRDALYEELWPFINKIYHQKLEIDAQLATSKNRAETIEAIIGNMREGLVILDDKGLVLAANKSVLDIFNIPKERDILRKNIMHIYRDPAFTQAVKQCLNGARLEINFARHDSVYNAYLNPVNGGGNSRGSIIFFVDATQQFKAETQRREFTANVSHELKTPLTTISALSEMMASGMAKPADMPDFAGKIASHTKRLMDIIDDIIRLSEFDENKTKREYTPFDISALAKTVIVALQDKAAEKAVTIEFAGQPLTIKANNHLMDELMYNLVDNGIKYNNEGGKISLSIEKENSLCKISVADTGIGIADEHQSRVFERFYRVDSSRSKKTGGTGLGLSIVKHIAEHHNGRVVLESVEGVGTTITCYIPV